MLEMRVELYANQRLADFAKQCGKAANRKRKQQDEKEWPLHGEDWSSMDESGDDLDKEVVAVEGPAKKAKKGSAVGWFGDGADGK